jgi:hypothetical protein
MLVWSSSCFGVVWPFSYLTYLSQGEEVATGPGDAHGWPWPPRGWNHIWALRVDPSAFDTFDTQSFPQAQR